MTRYIVEMDRTSNSSILPENTGNYIYSIRIFDTERDANAYVKAVWDRNNADDIYLMSVYKATTRKTIEHDGIARRVGVYRSPDCKNSIANENNATLNFYTMRTNDGIILGLGSASMRWKLETNRQID